MSMITITGVLINAFKAPKREDQKIEKDKIQVMGDIALPNGETRKDLITVGVPDYRAYQGREGSEVSIPVGAFAPQKGTVIYYGLEA